MGSCGRSTCGHYGVIIRGRSRDVVEPMRAALTDERRQAILEIKEQIMARGLDRPSIHVYRAVQNSAPICSARAKY